MYLAATFYGSKFKDAQPKDRKKMIDRCRQAVNRHQRLLDKAADAVKGLDLIGLNPDL
jgi:hypothetical protein